MSKRIIALFMALICTLLLASCEIGDTFKKSKVDSDDDSDDEDKTIVLTIETENNTYEVDTVEFNYYYGNYYNNLSSMASQYTQYYGYDPIGFDVTLQGMTTDEDGNEITWAEAIKQYVLDGIRNNYALYDAAVANGVTLDEDDKAEIDSSIEGVRTQADEYGYSLDDFLALYYGDGMNKRIFRKISERQAIAEKYSDLIRTDCTEAVELSEIEAVYNENKQDYDYVDVHYYAFSEDEEEIAQQIFDNITDLASFEAALAEYFGGDGEEEQCSTPLVGASYWSIQSATNSDMADWVYSAKRKALKKIVKDEENNKAYILYIDRAPYLSYSVDYYDCLVDSSEASSVLGEWDKTEEGFAKICIDYSSSEDTGITEDERITSVSNGEIAAWLFSADRKAGDTTTIEADDGTHILYFKAADKDDIDQYDVIRNSLADEQYEEKTDEIISSATVDTDDKEIEKQVNSYKKKIAKNSQE